MLHNKLQNLNEKATSLIEELSQSPPALLTRKPSPEKWSVLEIVEHLIISEELFFAQIMNAETNSGRKRTLKHRLLYKVVMFILGSPIRVKAPSRRLLPAGNQTLEDLRKRWLVSQEGFLAWLNSKGEGIDPEAALAWHPVAGPMTVLQAMDMVERHLMRHRVQIQALLAAN